MVPLKVKKNKNDFLMDESYKQFIENEKQMVFKKKKRCSMSLIIGE